MPALEDPIQGSITIALHKIRVKQKERRTFMTLKHPIGKKIIQKPSITLGDWFYMNSKKVNSTNINNSIKNISAITTEIWDDADILEIELQNKSSIDFEPLEPHFNDNNDNAFLIEHNILTLYMVTFSPEQFEEVTEIFHIIIEAIGGFFCADNEQFMPRIEY